LGFTLVLDAAWVGRPEGTAGVAERAGVVTRLAELPSAVIRRTASVERRTARQIGIVLVLAICALAFDAAFAVRHGFFDLRVYFGAINYWTDGTGEIYDYLLPRTKYGFTYPPFAALAMLPMALIGWHVAIVISLMLTVVSAVAVIYALVEPLARRRGWDTWFVVAVACCFAAVFEPMRETLLFGQVNAILLALVAADVLLLVRYNRSIAGVGIGIATAIKLTPGIFIVYLIITKRFRAAAVASGTTLAATVFAGAVAPDASREFWTDALWNTSRVGSQSFVSNQSLNGLVYRWNEEDPTKLAWVALVLAVMAVWAWRSRRAVRFGDEATGFALTGIVGVLVSPITWVHHLVWVMPALILMVDRGMAAGISRRQRRWRIGFAVAMWAIMSSRLVWVFNGRFESLGGWLGSNAYVFLCLILLVALPMAVVGAPASGRSSAPRLDTPDLVPVEGRFAALDAKPVRVPAQDEGERVRRSLVGVEHQ
jgi:alpha-1,2-mannosyltransferase